MTQSISRFLRGLIGPALAVAVAITVVPCCWAWQDADAAAKPADTTDQATEAAAEEKVDPLVVPDGTPSELMKYINELTQHRPTIRTRDEYIAFMKNQANSTLEAADKILDNDVKPTEAEVDRAVKAKLHAFTQFAQVGDKDTVDAVLEGAKKFPEQLQELGLEQYIKQAKAAFLNLQMSAALHEAIAKKDTAPIKKALVGVKKFVADAGAEIGRDELMLVSGVTRNVSSVGSMLGDNKIGVATLKEFSKILKDTKNEMAIAMAKGFEGKLRFEELPGNPMPLVGYKLDDEPFNIDELKGDVILVDFWATWCGPCLGEIPFMTEAYNAYHDKGFEIVGVSTDTDREALEAFVEKRETPWIILADRQPEREDYERQATYYGVTGIPTMVLIGKDGKVITNKARGKVLEEELAKIFGPIPKEEPSEEEATEEKAE